MEIKFGAVVLDTDDQETLAEFYARLLGWKKIRHNEWMYAKDPRGAGTPIIFQQVDSYQRPTWPEEKGKQQQMAHLDFYVDDVAAAVEYALSLGAARNPVQLEADWQVLLDPSGHPICILPNKPPTG